MSTFGIVLLLIGAGLEAVGIALVALENIDVRRALRKRNAAVFPEPARLNMGAFGADALISGGRTPTTEERLDALNSRIDALGKAVTELDTQFPHRVRAEVTPPMDSLRSELHFEVEELRRLLGVSVQPTFRRWLGLGAFGLGLGMQTLANLVG